MHKEAMRKCSMCGEYKPESNFRFTKTQNRYNAYCKQCERWYNANYKRLRRER
ncbi:hypothetical protein HMPREF9406_2598 [Clostridium sp. HGF2]|nr:hypothetical protein HMPREF9406_2598 [Clostridium sp. HGF2]